ncbi:MULTISPECIES: outer membrane protein transport protein [unclassified Psychrobacter]|uniref:outer membrane protein transport protein n=1 Tax=unclassified Psychrobacter TaxID=196806 RepID=UPI0025D4383F|nr:MULTISPECIES: outer membrane protein transport protein [unclassified Psychrobacter]
MSAQLFLGLNNFATFSRSSHYLLTTGTLTALSLAISSAHAAGIEYSKQSVAPFFEPGNYAELSYGYVDPKIEGTDAAGNKIGDMMDSFDLPGAAIKIAPTANTALAVIYEQPFGVDTEYPAGNIFNNRMGTTEARVETNGITLLGGGKIGNNVWLYGGLEYQTLKGNITGAQPVGLATPVAEVPTYYTLDFEKENTLVPVIGMAYEKPEIALRAALTYRAPAKYQVTGVENLQVILPPIAGGDGVTPGPATDEVPLPLAGKTEVKMPQSVNLDFQTGLSEKYQLLGMVNARWVDWSDFNVAPPLATLSTQEPLAAYKKDGYAVEVALGKQFNPKVSGEVRVGYDHGTGAPLSLLGPYDSIKSLGLSAQYKLTEQLSVAAGGQYMWFEGGPVDTKVDGRVANIDDGTGYALGMKLGYHF